MTITFLIWVLIRHTLLILIIYHCDISFFSPVSHFPLSIHRLSQLVFSSCLITSIGTTSLSIWNIIMLIYRWQVIVIVVNNIFSIIWFLSLSIYFLVFVIILYWKGFITSAWCCWALLFLHFLLLKLMN
jgi:hypothetical protein